MFYYITLHYITITITIANTLTIPNTEQQNSEQYIKCKKKLDMPWPDTAIQPITKQITLHHNTSQKITSRHMAHEIHTTFICTLACRNTNIGILFYIRKYMYNTYNYTYTCIDKYMFMYGHAQCRIYKCMYINKEKQHSTQPKTTNTNTNTFITNCLYFQLK